MPDIPPTSAAIPIRHHHHRHVAAGTGGPAGAIVVVAGRSASDGAVAVEVAAVGRANMVALGRVERFFGRAELGCRGLLLAPLLGQLPHDVRDFFVVFLEHVGEVVVLGTLDVAVFLAELALAAGVPRRVAVGDVNVRGLKELEPLAIGSRKTYIIIPIADIVIRELLDRLQAVLRNESEGVIRFLRTVIFTQLVSIVDLEGECHAPFSPRRSKIPEYAAPTPMKNLCVFSPSLVWLAHDEFRRCKTYEM